MNVFKEIDYSDDNTENKYYIICYDCIAINRVNSQEISNIIYVSSPEKGRNEKETKS